MQKNVAGQRWIVFAFNRTDNTPLTGDAANITANLRIDGGAANAVDDVNPTELEDGYYYFDITQAETNGDLIVIAPASTTADIQVIGVPGAVYTTPANFNSLSISAAGLVDILQTAADKVWLSTARTLSAFSTGLAVSIWNVLESAVGTASSMGLKVKNNLDAAITSRSSHDAAAVTTDMDANSTNLDTLITNVATLLTRLSSSRAGYLDKLNISGLVAGSDEVTVIQNNTRVVATIPQVLERPDSGSIVYKLKLYLYDSAGNMEAPDSLPTIAAENEGGTSRSGNLSAVTLVGTGRYTATYTISSAHALEQLHFEWTVVEGGLTRFVGRASLVVDTTAVDFTASDRTKLTAIDDLTKAAGNGDLAAVKAIIDAIPNSGAMSDLATILAAVNHASYGLAQLARSTTPANALTIDASGKIISSSIDAIAAGAVDSIHDEVFEGTRTFRQLQRLILAVLCNISAGGGTTTNNFRDDADTKNRVSATVDANGNRTAVSLDVT